MGTVRWWRAAAVGVAVAGTLLALSDGGDGGPAAGRAPGTVPSADDGGRSVVVGSITDGDTFRTTDGERVRLIGIDTPEVGEDECFAALATAALADRIPPGTAVILLTDISTVDRFGRTLAYVHRSADDLDVGLDLAADGFAAQLTVPPDVARAEAISAAVTAARDAGRGLWSACGAGS